MNVAGVSVADVGDGVDLTLTSSPQAAVVVTVYDPSGQPVVEGVSVEEAGSGTYPYTFVVDTAGMWKVVFSASGTATSVDVFYLRVLPVDGPAPLATVDDVVELFRPLTSAESTLVRGLIRHASALLRSRWPELDQRINSGSLNPDQAALAVVNMVLRVMRNQGGLRSESVGPFSRTFDRELAAGFLAVTEVEVQLLAPVQQQAEVAAATIRVRPGLAPPLGWRWRQRYRGSRDVHRW